MFFFSYGQKKTSLRDVDIVTIGSFPWILQKSHRDKQPTITAPHPCYQKGYKSTFHSKCKLSQIESKWVKNESKWVKTSQNESKWVKLSQVESLDWMMWCDPDDNDICFKQAKRANIWQQNYSSGSSASDPKRVEEYLTATFRYLYTYLLEKMHTKLDMPKNHLTKSITLPSCLGSESNINELLFFS